MSKLLYVALTIVILSLAPCAAAPAATMVEYGQVVSQSKGARPATGGYTVKTKSSPKKSKAKR